MNILADEAISAAFVNGKFEVSFKSGQLLTFPIDGNPRLERASLDALNNVELSPFGIHWPELDEDLSFEGILRGEYGQR
jgi:hypothetical protein